MNNLQEILLFPVRDAEARKEFLITSAILLLSFFIPLLPSILVMGYTARIMRQVIEDRKTPSMPAWQGSDWSEMLIDGLRIYGAQLVLTLPLFLLMGCGMIFMMGGSFGFAALAEENLDAIAPIGVVFMMLGGMIFMIFGVLSLPYSIVTYAALPHVAVKRSLAAAFEFKEWFPIFRAAIGQFVLAYVVVLAASFVLVIVVQVAMLTIVLLCIVPFLMVLYAAYQLLVMNAAFAQAYAFGRDGLQPA